MGDSAKDKNVKAWKVVVLDWKPQSLQSKIEPVQFPLFRSAASQGLYSPSPFGFVRGGWKTLTSLTYSGGQGPTASRSRGGVSGVSKSKKKRFPSSSATSATVRKKAKKSKKTYPTTNQEHYSTFKSSSAARHVQKSAKKGSAAAAKRYKK